MWRLVTAAAATVAVAAAVVAVAHPAAAVADAATSPAAGSTGAPPGATGGTDGTFGGGAAPRGVALLHMHDGAPFFLRLGALTLANKRRYAERHGYEMVAHVPEGTDGLFLPVRFVGEWRGGGRGHGKGAEKGEDWSRMADSVAY